MEYEPVFWMTSTLAQSISAVYGLYLVYYVFAMNGLRSETERIEDQEKIVKRTAAIPGHRHAQLLGITVWKMHVAESYVRLNTGLVGVSLLFLGVVEINLLIMSGIQREPLSDFALWTTLVFLIAITGGFSFAGFRWRRVHNDNIDSLKEIGKSHKAALSSKALKDYGFKNRDLKKFNS